MQETRIPSSQCSYVGIVLPDGKHYAVVGERAESPPKRSAAERVNTLFSCWNLFIVSPKEISYVCAAASTSMKFKYQHKKDGQEVSVVSVDLTGPPNDSEWMVTLSSGEQFSIHEFAEKFEPIPYLVSSPKSSA